MLPLAAVSTPPVPRFCSRRFSRILGKRLSWCPEKLSVLSRTSNKGVRALQLDAPWGSTLAAHRILSVGHQPHPESCPKQTQADTWDPGLSSQECRQGWTLCLLGEPERGPGLGPMLSCTFVAELPTVLAWLPTKLAMVIPC